MFNNNNNKNPNMDFTALGGNIFFSLSGMDKLRLKEANDLLNMMHSSTLSVHRLYN